MTLCLLPPEADLLIMLTESYVTNIMYDHYQGYPIDSRVTFQEFTKAISKGFFLRDLR